MISYVTRRMLSAAVVLLLDIVLVFFLLHLTPGDPAAAMLGIDQTASKEQLNKLRDAMGLNRPLRDQLFEYLGKAVRGDLGVSFLSGQSVTRMMARRLPVTLSLAATAMVLGLLIAIPAGVISAVRRGSLWDQGLMLFAIFGVSIPDYWLGIMLVLVFSVSLRLFPVVGFSLASFTDWARYIVLPTIAIGMRSSALVARMTRSSLLETLGQDFVALTARAKGIREWRVVLLHALPNAAFPIITVVGMGIAYLLGGIVVVEMVFALPGIGWLLINAVQTRDYQVIQGVLLFMAAVNVTANLLVDLSYALIDKRVRYD